jgi:hypothetical protein
VLLLAALLALVALLEDGRRPLEQAALLLCLLGTALAALGGNAVLLFGGLELANVGTVLLHAAEGEQLEWRDRAGFVVQHVAALGLLVAALRLQNQYQTADFALLSPGSLGTAIALGWAASGVARLLAAPGLAGRRGNQRSSAWVSVAAAPTGFLVLLRLVQVGGGDLPPGVGPVLAVTGLVIASVGAAEAVRLRTVPAAAGRALCCAAAGPVVMTAGLGGGRGAGAMAACALALCLALAMAPAWGGGGRVAAGRPAGWLRSLALVSAAGAPVGYGTVALLLSAGVVATIGSPAAVITVAFGSVALLTLGAGTAAGRAALAVPDAVDAVGGVRLDAVAAVALGTAAAVFPGVVQGTFIQEVVAGAGTSANAVDALAVRGPGGGWAGGYFVIAVLACVTMAVAAAVLFEKRLAPSEATAGAVEPPAASPWSPAVVRLEDLWSRCTEALGWFDRIDRWLEGQPSLAAVFIAAFVLMWVFR